MKNARKMSMENLNKENAAGNIMLEVREADLKNFSAGLGEPKSSNGMLCSVTVECNSGTLVFFCC